MERGTHSFDSIIGAINDARRRMEEQNNYNNGKEVSMDDLSENIPDDEVKSHEHVIMSLRMALAGYRHDLQKINEAYEKKIVDGKQWHRVTTTLENRIKQYDNAIKIIKEWEDD